MSTRPPDWLPLSERDPLPGDPMRIAQEASRLRDLGASMRGQVTRLREIGADSSGAGLYADKLREAANDLAGKLDKVVGRYEKTAVALKDWAPVLGRFQDITLAARTKALAAEELRRENTVITAVLAPGQELTPAQDAAARSRQLNLDEAATMLRQARDQMQDAVDDARSAGRTVRDKIRDAIDDEVRDSWWDNIKDFVNRNAGWIKVVSDALAWVATGVAVIAIILVLIAGSLVPGLNFLLWAGVAATVGAAIGHGALAATNSKGGSWFDFGLDIFALATFGTGRLVTSGLRGASAVTRTAGASAARRAATDSALGATRAARETAGRILADPRSSAGARRGARAFIDDAHRQANRAGTVAARQVRQEALRDVGGVRAFRAGDPGATRYADHALGLRARFPSDAAVQHASRNVDSLQNVGLGTFAAGSGVDASDRIAGALLGEENYDRFKGTFRREVGSTW